MDGEHKVVPPTGYPEPPPPYPGPHVGFAPAAQGAPVPPPGCPPSGGPVHMVVVGQWGPYPVQVSCPGCGATVLTATTASPGLLTWLLSGALVLLGCWLGCCLIPCCVPECQDVEHHCPNCKRHLGTFRRL